MKKTVKLIAIVLAVLMLTPFVSVYAESSKIEEVISKLNSSDVLKSLGATAKYENDAIEIEYNSQVPSYTTMEFAFEGNIVEYNPGQITNYEEASNATSCVMYAIQVLYSALRLNGYTEEQIKDYFASETNEPTFEVNGFEFKELGEAQKFDSDDGSASTTITPMSVKIDVTKANLSKAGDATPALTETTIDAVIENLNADDDFVSYKSEDGTLVFENTAYCEDGRLVIEHTDYTYDYRNIHFDCENGVLVYKVDEIADYDEASSVMEYSMWAIIIMQYALEVNGYTDEEISAFFNSSNVEFDYEKNGIEFKELGEEQEFKGDDGDLTITPVLIKIDFERASIDSETGKGEDTPKTGADTKGKKYKVLDGGNQKFDKSKGGKLTFRFDIDYDTFVKEGKVYIDKKEVASKKYTLSEGSTIVTFDEDYAKTLSVGKHTITVSVNNGEASADFTVSETKTVEEKKTDDPYANSPVTGDNSVVYIAFFMILSAVALFGIKKFVEQK